MSIQYPTIQDPGSRIHVAIIFPSANGDEWDARLANELASRADIRRVTLWFGHWRVAASGAAHLRRAVERQLARATVVRLLPASFAGDKVQVLSAEDGEVAELVRANRVDMVIDLSGALDTSAIAQIALGGVYQFWCDGVASGLDCAGASAAPSHEVAITIRRADWGRPRVVQRAVLTRIGASVELDRRNAAARAVALLLRAIDSRGANALDVPIQRVQVRPRSTAREMLVAVASVGGAVWRRVRRQWAREDAWFLAYRTVSASFVANSSHPRSGDFQFLDGGRHRFLADPCVLRHKGVDHVFMEEYPFDLGRGVISWSYLRPDGTLCQPERVLERPYHLSYPFVFEHDGEVWMIPESAAHRTVDLYCAVDFPRRWEQVCTLLDDVYATDATLHYDGHRWWMFVTVGEQNSYAWDELFLYFAEQPTGPWRPHPQNPVKSTPSSARPAGRLFRRRGVLLRPTQDCSRLYGGAVNICAVDVLTETEFAEHLVDTIPASWIPGAVALHTLSASQSLEVIDVRRPLRYRWS